MHRCLELARKGMGQVAPNPMVGAVLVYQNRIIGEGFHQQYGKAHAEVNCINSVLEKDIQYIKESTLYVSLEPCAHFGKTPPCTQLIIHHKIPVVVIGCTDLYAEVNGKGIRQLKDAGIEVICGVLEKEAKDLNKRFFTFHRMNRPYVILKWAQSSNHCIANKDFSRVLISNEQTNLLVHKWRSEETAIMVGTNTAQHDDPVLTNRHWPGNSPVRVVIDMNLRLPHTLKMFNGSSKTIVFNSVKDEETENLVFCRIDVGKNLIGQILNELYRLKIQSLLVEGGTKLLQSFIQSGYWDEARVITNETLIIQDGIPSPLLSGSALIRSEKILNDIIRTFHPKL